jgi:hypothetical protein
MNQPIEFNSSDRPVTALARVQRPVADDERVGVPFASLLTNKSGETIRAWHRKGLMPPGHKIGRDWMWRRSVITDWVAAGCPRTSSDQLE